MKFSLEDTKEIILADFNRRAEAFQESLMFTNPKKYYLGGGIMEQIKKHEQHRVL